MIYANSDMAQKLYCIRPQLKDFAFAVTQHKYFVMDRQAGSEFFLSNFKKYFGKIVTLHTVHEAPRLRQTSIRKQY